MAGNDRFSGPETQHAPGRNPAAPTGQSQVVESGAGGGGGRFSGPQTQTLQQWRSTDFVDQAQGWYTGRNTDGTRGGWNNDFVKEYNRGWNEALEQGTAADYFRNGGTGVVTWDHDQYEFGDVVRNGKVVDKLYGSDSAYSRTEAHLMMLPWLADGTTQRRLWEDAPGEAEVARRLEEFVSGAKGENNAQMAKALGAMEFQSDVDTTQAKIQGGAGDELLGGVGGAAGGAAVGASIGALFGGVGAAPGAAIGAIAGGIGGLLNKDEISEAAARSYEITKLAYEENNPLAATGTAVAQAAGMSMKLTSPLQNLTKGAQDWLTGDVGDGVSERYRVDDKGDSTSSLAWKVADWGSLVGDSLLQFASPFARMVYTGQMTSTIGGSVVELGAGGKVFDPREGGFDNVFVDDDGGFDPVSAAAGIGKIAIDAVQLGGVRGLARQSDDAAAQIGAGQRIESVAGHRFVLDDAGKVVGEGKKTMALLAPSEQIAWVSAARKARVEAAKRGDAVTADDFYRAAYNLSHGSSRLKTAVVNAFGEGYEEFAQAILEPVSVDGELSGKELFSAWAYGTAGGLGMSAGATINAPSADARMMAQAYVIETLRRGEEPDWDAFKAEWATLDPTDKRVRATRTAADAAATKAAQEVIARDHAATMIATELDAAKAMTAKRKKLEKELESAAGGRTDKYTVMGGIVEAGQVDDEGNLLGDTAPAEAVEASAATILELLENRERGINMQIETLDRVAEQHDAAGSIVEADETRALAASLRVSAAWGAQLNERLRRTVDFIYDETTTAADAQAAVQQMNRTLREVFEMRNPLVAPQGLEDVDPTELQFAASQFVSLIQSREPKLDSGSYLALLPRVSWDLTRDGDDNFLQVNTDILQAINGDFDGDKLRAENQLVLSRERFIQARAGQLFGGAGRELDVATRNFDKGLAEAMAAGLVGAGPLRTEADAAMAAIAKAIRLRYGSLMSPAALKRVLGDFETAVKAGSEDARVTLLNGLAREAGEAITNLGRERLRNEWLWASKIVRANFNAYQTQYRRLRNLDANGNVINAPTAEEAALDIDTPEGTQIRKTRATNDAQTLALYAPGNTLFRKFQKIHYTWFNSSVLGVENAQKVDLYELAALYEELAKGVTDYELARTGTDDTIAGRVLVMLSRLVDDALRTEDVGEFNPQAAMAILANVKVKDVWFDADGPVEGQGNMTVLQVLLRRALDADRELHKRTFDFDEKLQAKHAKLRALTVPNSVAKTVNAERAFIEVFKGIPFADSLGGNTGPLGVHTTPEQWLAAYIAGDADARRDLERLYTNTPEHLDRKDKSNIPYTLAEASRREISPYRSMMDAMLAVGRAELTFDPDKPAREAFGGRLGKANRQSMDDFREVHAQVQQALLSFRKIRGRSTPTREEGAALIQQMLNANPREGMAILDMVPNSAANALYEYRDEQLYVVPWVYEVLAEENTERALLLYWKNLMLARWNSLQVEGRRFDDLKSRTDQLLYQLAREPGELHLELMIRRLETEQSLDEFFLWLNTTPGFRAAGQAPLMPFVDDVAEFEGAAMGGGWATVKPGSELREAISKAKTAAQQLRQTMAFRDAKEATDKNIRDSIRDALNGDPDPLKQEYLQKFTKAVEISKELPRGFAPTAMLALTRGAVRSFGAGSHEKGKTSSAYKELGEFQALMDAWAFVPGLERVMEVATAHSMSSLRSNLTDLAKHGGTAMDANGRQVTWEPMTVEQALDMLDNPDTAPLAHALLTPTAMDVSPAGLSEKLLMEASLKDLLDNDHYRDLFNTDAQNQLDTDTRYLSMLDAYARKEGGHFDAIRMANDLAIVMTSGLGKKMTAEKEDELTAKAYRYVAQVMRMVGQIQATPTTRDDGVLDKLRDFALSELRGNRSARHLPGFTAKQSGELMKDWVADLQTNLEMEFDDAVNDVLNRFTGAEQTRRLNALRAQHEMNKRQIESFLDDNPLQSVVSRFELTGDLVADQAQHARITEYVMSMSNFPNRAPEATAAWTKLAGQRRAGLRPDLSIEEWDVLSRAAMGVTLADESLRVATHVSIPSLPAGLASSRFYQYFDPTYSFIAENLLDANSPLAKAAVWLHTVAEQPRTEVSFKAVSRTLKDTVLNTEAYGTWTPGLMAQLVEAQQRMDSAGAPPGIGAAGNGPKRWAAVAAATRRTGAVPKSSLLTTASVPGSWLAEDAHPFNEFVVEPAGVGQPRAMHVAGLENRFFASIKVDGVALNLAADNLGFEWDGADQPNPYRYVSLERLRPVVQRAASAAGKDLADVTVEMEFFHPDSQPVGEWNNAFFEGMSHSLLPDGSESLIATLWSDNGGRISADTQWTIDAGKKGLRAIMPFRRDKVAAGMAEAEEMWETDRNLAGLLRLKTELVASYDDGSGAVGPAAYNALYKIMKLQHVVVLNDGRTLSAEEALALQATDPDALATAKLVKLSPDVLRTLLGDTGDQGVDRFFDDEYILNPSLIEQYQGLPDAVTRRFLSGWQAETGRLADTSLANVGQQRVMRVRTVLTKEERNARAERKQYLDRRAASARAKRYRRLKDTDARRTYKAVLETAKIAVDAERTPFDIGGRNSAILGPRDIIEGAHTLRLLETYNTLAAADGYERGWLVRDDGAPDYPGGVLTMESLFDPKDKEHWVVKDDLALVQLDSFQKPERSLEEEQARVEKALDFLTDSGAYVVLGSGNGAGDLRFHASKHLEARGYVRIEGSRHLYGPAEFVYQTQNERAYESTLIETGRITPAHQAITFLALDPIGTDENMAILNPDSRKLRTRKLLGNLVRSSAYPKFNVPTEDNRDRGVYARALDHLRNATDPANVEYRAELLKMGGVDPRGAMPLEDALNRFHARITNRATLEPQVGDDIEVGDIIPFVSSDGKTILYRHGMQPPHPRELDKLFRVGGMNIAVGQSKIESMATANSGRIVNIENRSGYGKRLVLETKLQPHGDKVQLEWNGMKYILVPKPESFGTIPPVFGNGVVVDMISDVQSADSKEAFGGRVYGLRNALTFFQFDFTDDLVEFFFPGAKPSDSNHGSRRLAVTAILEDLANQDEARIPFTDANVLAKANVAVGQVLGDFAAARAKVPGAPTSDWIDRLQDTSTPSALIARAMITYLLTPGANHENVLRSAGFSHPRASDAAVETRQVPGLFAALLDNGMDSPLHKELIRRFDRQLRLDSNGAGWKLHEDWTVEMFDGTGKSIRGYLQFGEAHSSGDNPVLDGQAFDASERTGVSLHNALAASGSVGAISAHDELEKYRDFARSFTPDGDVDKFGETGDSVWHMLTALPDEPDLALSGWRRETPAETVRRSLAREEITPLFHELDTSSWDKTTNEEVRYHTRAMGILNRAQLHGAQRAMVDHWIRVHLGRPYGTDENGNDVSVISFEDAMQVLSEIERNLKDGQLPVAGAAVPLMDINHLTTLYLANLGKPDSTRWKLLDNDGSEVTSWDGWVEMAFGTAFGMEGGKPAPRFDTMYLLAIDGLMHGYQGATSNTRYLPVSTETLRQQLLMDPQTNKMLVSISGDENLLATDPTLFASSQAELEDIMAGQRIFAPGRNGPDPASAKGKQVARTAAWRREGKVPRQVGQSIRSVRREGQMYIGYTTTTTNYWRSFMNLRVGNTLLDLSLAVAAPFEAFVRRSLNLAANTLTGEATGATGRLAAKLGVSRYTPEQMRRITELTKALSTRPEFKAMIFKEIVYQYPHAEGIGPIEKWLERYARFGAKLQDPSLGMLPQDLARTYLEAVLKKNATDPTGENLYSIERMLASLPRDPSWLKRQDEEAHNMGIAAIANVRSVKPNVISLGFRGFVEPLASSPKLVRNSAGNMLKILTAFQNFWANFGTNITGMQGAVDFMAFMLDGRKKNLTARMQAALAGREYVPEDAEYFNMSEALESIDLADAFIKGGVTHSALFALGMMAGGLGLGGEDEEEKFRRRQAELQGVPLLHDPRDLEADFRNKDSIFLNWLPFGMDSWFQVDPNDPDSPALAQMNWITRTFLSPVLGFERFYRTGDFSEVIHGFKDAVGSHPIVNATLWNAATDTAAYLQESANDAAEADDMVEASHLLMTAVGVMERMLLENSMINLVYVGRDEWDRDPYILPLRDSDGDLQRDIEGQVRPNDLALKSFINDEGEVQQGYLGRSQAAADFRTLTENRGTLALISSLFTGGLDDSDFWRYNMPIKTREIDRGETSPEDAETLVRAAVAYQLAQLKAPNVTPEEALPEVRNQMYALGDRTGQFFTNDQVWQTAQQIAADKGLAALSIIDEHGVETLTDKGLRGLYNGLLRGTIDLDDPEAMRGIAIPYEVRQKIAAEWSKELVQEGIDLGLDQIKANARMQRLMQGGFGGPEEQRAGLADILFDTRIPSNNTLVYGQLNTTYVMGPDGKPWATGFRRDGLLGALGLKPLKAMLPVPEGMARDARGNAVDLVNGANTGLRGLVPFDDSRNVPTDKEIGDMIAKAIEDAAKATYTPSQQYEKGDGGSGSGWRNYGRGYRRYGGYGGGGGGGGYFNKMYALPDNVTPYGNSTPFINSSNPILRRAFVRRERVWSERGRLKQWQ